MTAATRQAFEAVRTGVEPLESAGRRIAMLVPDTDVSSGRDAYVAAGLGRQLARLGLGVRLVPKKDWYTTKYAETELLVATVPGVNVRLLPAGLPVLAWIRDGVEDWRRLPALEDYSAVLASSELGRDYVAERYRGPLGMLPSGFDDELFADGPGAHSRPRLAVSSTDHRQTDPEVLAAFRRLPKGTRLDWYGTDGSRDRLISRFHRGRPVSAFGRPGLYRRSVLTIEGTGGTAAGWGHRDSSLFEALACGSLVVTNTPLGLSELGLERLPVYRTAGDLTAILERARAGGFADLAREMHDVVRARHGWARRAASLVEFATTHDLWSRPERPGRVINFLPDWTRTNPFQHMLYGRLPDDVRAVPSTNPVSHLVLRDDGGDLDGQVVHVHWQNIVLQPSRNHAEATRRLGEFTETVTDLIGRGMKLVWTIHNRMPHEVDYYFHEIELCRFLARHAQVIHVLSEQTLDAVGDLFALDPHKVVVVEHGSYAGVYPELLDRTTARARLKLLPSERVALFFGGVRPYKGLEQLVEVFERIYRTEPDTHLLLVGQPGRTMDKEFLARLERLPFVTTQFGFVPDSDVHVYFRAADVQVAPYSAVLNSGSVLLGLSFGLPVVAPRLGALNSLATEPFMFPFQAQNAAELEQALRGALGRSADTSLPEAAVAFAQGYTGADMSDAFVREVLDRVWQPAAARSD